MTEQPRIQRVDDDPRVPAVAEPERRLFAYYGLDSNVRFVEIGRVGRISELEREPFV